MIARNRSHLLLLALLAAGCGDGGGGPGGPDDAARIAERFDDLADSIGTGGHEPTAEALRHAADLVRLAGAATPVTLTIDGSQRQFLAVAEQFDFPLVVCTYPADSGTVGGGTGGGDSTGGSSPPMGAPDGQCTESGTQAMRTLIAWEPETMAEVVRVVADTGATPAQGDVPDVMTGLPTFEGDSAVGGTPVSSPGFSGEYLVRDLGSWWVTEGSQANGLEAEGGACTDDRVTFDWAELACELASLRFEFAMTVSAATWEYLAGGERSPSEASGTHRIEMPSTVVDVVRLTVLSWQPPPEPGPVPPPLPVDTVTTLLLEVGFEAVEEGGVVVLRLRVANPTAEPITFDFPSGQRYDFGAYDANGQSIWRWSADKAFAMVFASVTLQPGEALEYEERWDPGDASGELILEASLVSQNLPVVRTVTLPR